MWSMMSGTDIVEPRCWLMFNLSQSDGQQSDLCPVDFYRHSRMFWKLFCKQSLLLALSEE
jgi:hypothetical protein